LIRWQRKAGSVTGRIGISCNVPVSDLAVAGFQVVGTGERYAVVREVDEAFAAKAGEEATDGFAGEANHVAELLVSKLQGEGDGEAGSGGNAVELAGAGQVEEAAGEFSGGGGTQREASGGLKGTVVLARKGQGGGAADVGVGFHEAHKVSARDGLDGATGEGFDGGAMKGVGAEGGEAKDFAGAVDAEKEQPACGRAGGGFDSAAADDDEVVGGETFAEEDFAGFMDTTDTKGMEVVKDSA